MRWEGKLGGGMRPTVVQQENDQAIRKGLREGIDEKLAHLGVQIRPLQAEPSARHCLHGAIPIALLEDMRHWPDGLHATRGEASAANRQQVETTLVLTAHPDWTGSVGWNGLRQAVSTARLEGGNRLRVLLCDWGGPR
jgi:hypothetical protein